MQTQFEKKRLEVFRKKITVLLFELTKNKYRIRGFVDLKGKDGAFCHLLNLINMFRFKNCLLEISSDFMKTTLEEVKANSDFCILFTHVGNAKELDIQVKMYNLDFIEIVFFTTEDEMTFKDADNLWFLDEEVIYEMELVPADDRGLRCKRTLRPEYKYLFE